MLISSKGSCGHHHPKRLHPMMIISSPDSSASLQPFKYQGTRGDCFRILIGRGSRTWKSTSFALHWIRTVTTFGT